MFSINFAVLTLVAAGSSLPFAENECAKRVGTTIVPQSFDQTLAPLPKAILPKGEFETTSAYDARVAVVSGRLTSAVVMARPVDAQTYPEPVFFDADLQLLKIRNTAFDWGTANWDLAFVLADQKYPVGRGRYHAATVISRTDRPTGTYKAANRFGTPMTVSKISRTTDSLWAHTGRDKDDHLFAGNPHSIIGSIALSADQVKILKPRIRFALVVVPKYPFLVTGKLLETVPTMDDSRLVTERFRILIADVQCGLVLDGANNILGAYPVK